MEEEKLENMVNIEWDEPQEKNKSGRFAYRIVRK
jgi:hypothetical protein